MVDQGFIQQAATKAGVVTGVTKKFGKGAGLAVAEGKHIYERIQERIKPTQQYTPPADIDFALLSKKAGGLTMKDRMVDGYTIIPKYTS